MNLGEAEVLAKSEMAYWLDDGWSFGWDDAKSRFGVCRSRAKEICLSRVLVEMNELEPVLDTIRHEIAHALSPVGEHHGWRWQEACRMVGADPSRCFGDEVAVPKFKWTGTCPSCQKEISRRTLFKEARRLACLTCCNEFNAGEWSAQFLYEWTETK